MEYLAGSGSQGGREHWPPSLPATPIGPQTFVLTRKRTLAPSPRSRTFELPTTGTETNHVIEREALKLLFRALRDVYFCAVPILTSSLHKPRFASDATSFHFFLFAFLTSVSMNHRLTLMCADEGSCVSALHSFILRGAFSLTSAEANPLISTRAEPQDFFLAATLMEICHGSVFGLQVPVPAVASGTGRDHGARLASLETRAHSGCQEMFYKMCC